MIMPFNRRDFFKGSIAAVPLQRFLDIVKPRAQRNARADAALDVRTRASSNQAKRLAASMKTNGDEDNIPNRAGCFSKGLPRNQYGEVEPAAYSSLLAAMQSGRFSDFERIPRAGGRRLSNPQSAFTFHLEGGDPYTFDIPPAPSVTSPDGAFELSELYWQTLSRDIPFADYKSSLVIQKAAAALNTSPANIFRGSTRGDLAGPYISQFLLKPIPYGAGRIDQRYTTPIAGSDFMATQSEWSQIQAGFSPWRAATYDSTPRYIRNGRDLAEYVHYDFAYQAYLGAALILINSNAKSVLNCNQFKSGNNPYRYSTVEEGFVTFGPAEAADWLGRVTTAALKAAYCQKWMVHRRLRPEALGGLIHQTRVGTRKYPLHDSLLHASGIDEIFRQTGSYLLPQAYPEGCPLHPSYPAGHAAVAGACSVILKASFDGYMLLPGCVETTADGLSLIPSPNFSPTLGDEINKLAFNVAMGRNWAGIHFRSDDIAGLQLGEEVGISILQDMALTYTEDFHGFSFERFDGRAVKITPQGSLLYT